MALVCGEHRADIRVGDDIFGALLYAEPGEHAANVAFCKEALDAIPANERLSEPTEADPTLICIRRGTSRANLGGLSTSYSWSDLRWEGVQFYITRETLRRHLPEVAIKLLGA